MKTHPLGRRWLFSLVLSSSRSFIGSRIAISSRSGSSLSLLRVLLGSSPLPPLGGLWFLLFFGILSTLGSGLCLLASGFRRSLLYRDISLWLVLDTRRTPGFDGGGVGWDSCFARHCLFEYETVCGVGAVGIGLRFARGGGLSQVAVAVAEVVGEVCGMEGEGDKEGQGGQGQSLDDIDWRSGSSLVP